MGEASPDLQPALPPPSRMNPGGKKRTSRRRGPKPSKPVNKRGSVSSFRLSKPSATPSAGGIDSGTPPEQPKEQGSWVSKILIPPGTGAGDKIVVDMADGVSILFTVPTGVVPHQIIYVNDRGHVVPKPGENAKEGCDIATRMLTIDVQVPEYIYGEVPSTSLSVAHPHGGEVIINVPPGSKSGDTLHVQVPSRQSSITASSRRSTGSTLNDAFSPNKERVILSTKWKYPMETEIKVTDTHVRTKWTSYVCCCCCRFPFNQTLDTEVDAINGISTSQPSNAGTCALVTLYAVWFFFGPLG